MFNPATLLCLSQARIWIFVLNGLRCEICSYWCNIWPLMFKFSFPKILIYDLPVLSIDFTQVTFPLIYCHASFEFIFWIGRLNWNNIFLVLKDKDTYTNVPILILLMETNFHFTPKFIVHGNLQENKLFLKKYLFTVFGFCQEV